MNNLELAVQLFLQLAVIIFACRIVGFIALKLGQPQVVAEMITGVCLGPSLLGLYFPEVQEFIFPWDKTQTARDTQSYLYPLSQLGLALYMFIVGMEFRVDIIIRNLGISIGVSLAGMIVPFFLGGILAYYFYFHTELFPQKTSLFEACLFLGSSMCITAFPMLARIIHFKNLTGTRMGTVAIGAGAIDDATAWCLLAVVLASFDNNISHAVINIGGGVAFFVTCQFILKPILYRSQNYLLDKENNLTDSGLATCLILMSLGACVTDYIGLHAVFGAFMVGTIIPREVVTRNLINKIQPLTIGLLLPLFFTYSGLNTKINLLNSWYLWGICGLVLTVAILGKGAACYASARFSGLSNHEAIGIGALMNARGLMELIIINIGLQRGIISEELFATLVIMAVITTLMASPIFDMLFANNKSIADDSTYACNKI